jgi:hypothetical protein
MPSDRARRAAAHAIDMESFVLDLRQLGRGDLARAGGKGANLGELVRHDFPVPSGYERFVAHNSPASRTLSSTWSARTRCSMRCVAAGRRCGLTGGSPTGADWVSTTRSFLDAYGHREAGGTMQVSRATWKDAPEVVVGMLQGLARTEPRRQLQRPVANAIPDELLRHPLLGVSFVRSGFVDLVREARRFPQLREDTRFYFMLPLPVLRRTLLELGRRLAEARVLDDTADVFHLRQRVRVDGTAGLVFDADSEPAVGPRRHS